MSKTGYSLKALSIPFVDNKRITVSWSQVSKPKVICKASGKKEQGQMLTLLQSIWIKS
jgi:hypothetical protein